MCFHFLSHLESASLSVLSVSRVRAQGKVPEWRDDPDVGTGDRPPADTNSGGRGGANKAGGETGEGCTSDRVSIRAGPRGSTAQ
jgi:hypothetical protein